MRRQCQYQSRKSRENHDEKNHGLLFAQCSCDNCLVRRGAAANENPPDRIPKWLPLLSANAARIEAFRQGLRELGYVEGKNIVIEWRSAEGKLDRLPALAAELVRLKVDVIVTAGSAVTRAAKEATVYDSHRHGAG